MDFHFTFKHVYYQKLSYILSIISFVDLSYFFQLCVALSYSIIIAAVVGKASHHIPLRLYVDEEKDTSIGIFVHPYIPFKMQKIEIPFHSLKIRESERLSTWNHFNHLGKYYLEEENFISRIYYQRLLSQNKPY